MSEEDTIKSDFLQSPQGLRHNEDNSGSNIEAGFENAINTEAGWADYHDEYVATYQKRIDELAMDEATNVGA